MRKLTVLLSLTLSVAACQSTVDRIMRDMRSLEGHPIGDAIARYGHPRDVKATGGETIYVWSTNVGSARFVPCTMRFVVGSDGLIKRGDVSGDEQACRAYAAPLD